MGMIELMMQQALDPFRIGLLLALVVTAYNTAQVTGVAVPLTLGIVFVAFLVQSTTSDAAGASQWTAFASGIVVNALIVGVLLLARAAWKQFASPKPE